MSGEMSPLPLTDNIRIGNYSSVSSEGLKTSRSSNDVDRCYNGIIKCV